MTKPSRKLVTALTDSAQRAFTEVREAHPDEQFYVFALFSETGDDLQPTCHSEEALERVVAKHRKRKKRKSPAPDADELRFFAEEFEYHQTGEEHFKAVEEITDSPGADGFAAAVAALKRLGRKGFFGRGKERERVAVLILMSDQSSGHVMEYARKLNPKRVVARLAKLFPERAATGTPTTIGEERAYSIDGIAISADRRCIAAAGGFGGDGVFVWSLRAKHALLFRDKVPADSVWAVALSAKGDVLYGKGKSAVLRWDLRSKKKLPPIEVSGNKLSVIALSPDGTQLACASYQSLRQAPWTKANRIAVVDTKTGAERALVETEAWALAFSPDGAWLAHGSRTARTKDAEMLILLRDAQKPTLPPVRRMGDGRRFTQLAFSPDGGAIAAADGEQAGLIAMFSVADGQQLATFGGHEGRVTCLAFSPDGTTLAATDDNGTLKCWATASGKLQLDVHGKHESLSAVAFLDADRVAAGGRDVDEGPPISVWQVR